MVYVLDTNSFIVLSHYFPGRFPSFWDRFNEFVSTMKILSTREVFRELDNNVSKPHLREWIDSNRSIFLLPSSEETDFVREIFTVPQFQHLLQQKKVLTGGPVADPFVIASARVRGGCVITEETLRNDAVRIPSICKHFGIRCTNLEGLMEREGWAF
jgi:hypothetical protein